jgi:glycosyltransferase involved in cell wall biosynthesis
VKLLLVAPTCDGEDVGEAWVAFNWAKGLARHHDVTLLTYHKRGRTPASRQLSGLRVVEWQEPPLLGRAERLNSMLKPGYVAFHARARRWVKAALARGERFDVAFQPVPVAMRYPCPARGLGIPYVMGPVGGSLGTPPGFADDEGSAPWYVGLRALDRWRVAHDPWLRRTYADADCVLGIAPYVREFLHDVPVRRFEWLSETAVDSVPERLDRSDRTGPVRLLFVGRLIRTKGARDAIRALSLAPDLPVLFDVVGDGFDREACENLARELGVADKVVFHGRLPRDEVDALYRAADVFVFPSYREPGGNVTFEAMAWSLPLVVSDLGGPGNVVDDTCGIRVHPETPETYAADLARAVTFLVENPDERRKLGEGAWRRVQQVGLWESKVQQVGALFEELATAP